MPIQYEIRQQVKTAIKSRLETIHSQEFERGARFGYKELVKKYPTDYFELVKVEHTETCLEFTPRKDSPNP